MQFVTAILRGTPVWVWGLLAGLIALGFTQSRDRTASLTRMIITPAVMTALAVWGLSTAFASSGNLTGLTAIWFASAAFVVAVIASLEPPQGTQYDATSATFSIKGSWIPMFLILGIFLTRYAVNVALAIDRSLVHNVTFALVVAALYGIFSGIFVGRTLRIVKLALPQFGMRGLLQRDPW